jgi:hypothetical protein
MKLNQTKQEIKKSVLKSLKLNNIEELSTENKYETDSDDDDASLDSDQEVIIYFKLWRIFIFLNFTLFPNESYNWHLHASN